MARAWRIEYEGALYHVLSRGNNHQDIFHDDKDRWLFLDTLGEMSERFEIDIFAYVLMGNHYHVLLKTNRANLSKGMQWLGLAYTRRFNLRHSHSGHLFQGRFKSILVENDAYLSQLSCYIHRNPLRAHIVKRLADYRWSSYRVYAYNLKGPAWLKTDPILSRYGKQNQNRAYREKMQRHDGEEKRFWEDLRHGVILGTTEFVEKVRGAFLPKGSHKEIPQQGKIYRNGDPLELVRKAAESLGADVSLFRKTRRISKEDKFDRDLLVYGIWKTGMLTNEKIGSLFGLSYSSVSHIVKSAKTRLAKDEEGMKKFNTLYSLFKM